jgi:hypothetical protein
MILTELNREIYRIEYEYYERIINWVCKEAIIAYFDAFLLFFIIISGARLRPLGTVATNGLLHQPWMIDDDDCGAIGGMKISSGN